MHAQTIPSLDETEKPTTTGAPAAPASSGPPAEAKSSLPGGNRAEVKGLSFWYGKFQALQSIDLPVVDRKVTALIGPSGCGKTTFLRCFNRMHDLYSESRYEGEIRLYPENENLVTISPTLVRLRVGMVFQKPNPFPKSIYANVTAGLTIRGIKKRSVLDEKVEWALQQAGLWKEVKDRLHTSAYGLSGGQQQRLCIARALAPEPEMILFDEPTSALDPAGTAKIEELVQQLAGEVTIVIVTHNMQQASRISDYTAFMLIGDMVEYGETKQVFSSPRDERTEQYITGRFG